VQKYLSVEILKCTGCRICEAWCSFTKVGECGPTYSRIRLYSIEKEGLTIPLVCHHCEKAFCMVACPTRALKRDRETGAVLLDHVRCIGCGVCISVCPFAAISLDPKGKVIKCDLCKGLPQPVCVARCPKGALIWEQPHLLTLSKKKAYANKSAGLLREPV
jgi:carbon-monoxide dehydrogenase iron sulfur subunit